MCVNISAVSIPDISLYKVYENLKTSEYNRKIYYTVVKFIHFTVKL